MTTEAELTIEERTLNILDALILRAAHNALGHLDAVAYADCDRTLPPNDESDDTDDGGES